MFAFEREAIEAIAARYPEEADVIRVQARHARVKSRKNTGAGFYTALEVNSPLPGLLKEIYPGPFVDIAGLEFPASLILWTNEGVMDELELAAGGSSTTDVNLAKVSFSFRDENT